MSVPFYVSPEQLMADKAEYARKGIARGKSIVALEYASGIALVAENRSAHLSKIGEIYDRLAFAGVGRFGEFDQLRKIGVRYADVKGYGYSREDVRGKALANAYSQAIGDVFTREMKPLEVEIVVAEVGIDELAGQEENSLYRIQFDGSIVDHDGYCVIGGNVENIEQHLRANYRERLALEEAVKMAKAALECANANHEAIASQHLEICILDRERAGRKFRRLAADEISNILGS